tara:strand:- start:2204 stop:2500 length:297 start_codon:yes stop_codon:yes gene_type:complete
MAVGEVLVVLIGASGNSFQPSATTEYLLSTFESGGGTGVSEAGHYDGATQAWNFFDADASFNAWLTTANMKFFINNSWYIRFQNTGSTNNFISGMQIK